MSRTSTALKRLGVPGLAAITLVAGLPLFMGTAAAAPIGSLTITPVDGNDTGAAGSCQAYYIDAAPATAGTSTVGETVNVILTDASGTGTAFNTSNADFCTAPTGSQTPAGGTQISSGGPQTGGGSTDQREFVLQQNGAGNNVGRVVIGITKNQPGTVTIQAYSDTNNNDQFNAGEPQAQRTTTFTDGGPAGSNTNQDAATTVEVIDRSAAATATVTVDADSDTVVEGEARTYRVAVLNANGDRLAGVTVNYQIDSNVNSADRSSTVFATTDNNGIATGTVTFPTRSGTPTTDQLTFFVNQTGLASTSGLDAAEPRDTVAVTVVSAANQQNRTVTLTPIAEGTTATNYSTSGDAAVNPATDTNRVFRAVVDAADGQPATTGTLLAFGVSGGSGDETVTPFECSTGDYTTGAGDPSSTDVNNSFCDVTVNDPTPVVGQTLTVSVTVRGSSAADTATLTFRNQPGDARTITLTPETVTVAPNTAQQLTATVRDADGNGVQGVTVTFTETGAGAFRNGSSSVDVVTNAQGVATVETISLPGETGTQTVTATISGAATQCDELANRGTDPQGNAHNTTNNTAPAGVCSDSSTVTYGTATQSPSPGTTTPPNCSVTPTVTLEFGTINATGSSGVTVTAPANSQIQLLAYSQPSTTYRVVRQATIDNIGTPAQFRIVPPTNTRLYAQIVGCDTDEVRFSKVLNVRTTLSLNVTRTGVRAYRFFGDSLPARPGGLIVSLYRVTNDGRQILTSQTRASASTGDWVINRVFTGTGRFGFVVRTGQDLQNAPGASNVRSLLIF